MFTVIGTSLLYGGERYLARLETAREKRKYTGDDSTYAPYNFDRVYPIFLEYAIYYYLGKYAAYPKGKILSREEAFGEFKGLCEDVALEPTSAEKQKFDLQWKQDVKLDMY